MPQVGISDLPHSGSIPLKSSCPSCKPCCRSSVRCRWPSVEPRQKQWQRYSSACGGGDETLIVVSSDLSHPPTRLPRDRRGPRPAASSPAIPTSRTTRACGATPLNGLLLAARHHGLHARKWSTCATPAIPPAIAAASSAMAASLSIRIHRRERPCPVTLGRELLTLARSAIAARFGQSRRRRDSQRPGADGARGHLRDIDPAGPPARLHRQPRSMATAGRGRA